MNILTKEEFKKLPFGEIFATGVLSNPPEGIFMTKNDGELRWVAKKGWGYDWAIYCYCADKTAEWIRDHGDKIFNEEHIKRCVPCTDEVFQLYRF